MWENLCECHAWLSFISDWMTNFREDFRPVRSCFLADISLSVHWDSEMLRWVIFLECPSPLKRVSTDETQLLKMMLIRLLGRVVQSPIKPTQG